MHHISYPNRNSTGVYWVRSDFSIASNIHWLIRLLIKNSITRVIVLVLHSTNWDIWVNLKGSNRWTLFQVISPTYMLQIICWAFFQGKNSITKVIVTNTYDFESHDKPNMHLEVEEVRLNKWELLISKTSNRVILGEVKEVALIPNIHDLCMSEVFIRLDIQYIGGL